jgi:site-specific DNA recombinase
VKNRKLVVNDAEGGIVVEIYRRYLVLKSVHALRDELADAGIKSKRRTRPDGAPFADHLVEAALRARPRA